MSCSVGVAIVETSGPEAPTLGTCEARLARRMKWKLNIVEVVIVLVALREDGIVVSCGSSTTCMMYIQEMIFKCEDNVYSGSRRSAGGTCHRHLTAAPCGGTSAQPPQLGKNIRPSVSGVLRGKWETRVK